MLKLNAKPRFALWQPFSFSVATQISVLFSEAMCGSSCGLLRTLIVMGTLLDHPHFFPKTVE
jgi:hypothetical protein